VAYVLWMNEVVFSTRFILCDGLMIAHNVMIRVTNYTEGKKVVERLNHPLCQM